MSDIKKRLEEGLRAPGPVDARGLCQDALRRIEQLESDIEILTNDNDNHWGARAKLCNALEVVINRLRDMRRTAQGEDS